MKHMITIIIFLCSWQTSWADRALYTMEKIEGALIAVWHTDDISLNGDELKLKRSQQVLQGDVALKGMKFSARLKYVIRQIKKGQSFILFIHVNNGTADLVCDSGKIAYSHIAVKALKSVIAQHKLKKKWSQLSIKEQIESSDFIVVGNVNTSEESVKSYALKVDTVYRGLSPKNLMLLPLDKNDDKANTKKLFFIQLHKGTGANYIMMHSLPVAKAKDYLKLLKKHKSE